MKKRDPVSKIMTSDLTTVNQKNNLLDVKKIFDEKKLRHIPVVSGNKLVGLISQTDFYRITYNVGEKNVQGEINDIFLNTLTIEDVMTKNLETVESSDTIHYAAEVLMEKDFHAIPVLENGNLKGIVTTTDIIKYLLEQY